MHRKLNGVCTDPGIQGTGSSMGSAETQVPRAQEVEWGLQRPMYQVHRRLDGAQSSSAGGGEGGKNFKLQFGIESLLCTNQSR